MYLFPQMSCYPRRSVTGPSVENWTLPSPSLHPSRKSGALGSCSCTNRVIFLLFLLDFDTLSLPELQMYYHLVRLLTTFEQVYWTLYSGFVYGGAGSKTVGYSIKVLPRQAGVKRRIVPSNHQKYNGTKINSNLSVTYIDKLRFKKWYGSQGEATSKLCHFAQRCQ